MYNAKKNRVTLPLMIVKAKPQARASSNPLKMLRNRLTDGMPDVTVSNSRAKQTSRTHSHGHKELVLVRGRDAVGCTHTRIRRGHTHTSMSTSHRHAVSGTAERFRGFRAEVVGKKTGKPAAWQLSLTLSSRTAWRRTAAHSTQQHTQHTYGS